jgi:hypothetical protein
MSEHDWLACDDSIPMAEFLLANLGDPFDSPFDKVNFVLGNS